MKQKKAIVVLINSSISELDWIMPVLSYYSKNYYILTYFKNPKIYKSLKENKALFHIWEKINHRYFIEKYYDLFFLKLCRKILFHLNINYLTNDYFEKKLHGLQRLKKIFQFNYVYNNFSLNLIFSDFGVNSGWVKIITKYSKKRPKIIHYPHTPSPYNIKKKINNKYKLLGDNLLVGRKEDKIFFSNYIDKKKIITCNTPRYAKSWNKKILKNSDFDFDYNKIKNSNIITLAYVSKFNIFKKKKIELKKQINDIMKVITEKKNTVKIIKIHPRKNSSDFLSIIKKYDQQKWLLSKIHLSKLSIISKSIICHPNSAAGLDAVSQNIPAIQLQPIKHVENEVDILENLGLVKRAQSPEILKKLIYISINQPNHKIWKTQINNFKKNYPKIDTSLKSLDKFLIKLM